VLASDSPLTLQHRLAYRVAGACACATFPLIWVGGLVTTYEAGMAVPDWPSTYGDHLWWYPWAQWVSGPWDLFIEHGHRLLGSLVGVLSLMLLAIAWWPWRVASGSSGTLRGLSVLLFLAVLSQGVLGGMRVWFDERDLARLHGICGPLVFTWACVVWACTSPAWSRGASSGATASDDAGRSLQKIWCGWACLTFLVVCVQVVLGAFLRHVPWTMAPASFRLLVLAHVAVALLMLWCIAWLAWHARSRFPMGGAGAEQNLVHRHAVQTAIRLILLIHLQLALGLASWVTKYAWPEILAWIPGSRSHVVLADGLMSAMTVTAHVAVGALILANAAIAPLWGLRVTGCCCVPSMVQRTARSSAGNGAQTQGESR